MEILSSTPILSHARDKMHSHRVGYQYSIMQPATLLMPPESPSTPCYACKVNHQQISTLISPGIYMNMMNSKHPSKVTSPILRQESVSVLCQGVPKIAEPARRPLPLLLLLPHHQTQYACQRSSSPSEQYLLISRSCP